MGYRVGRADVIRTLTIVMFAVAMPLGATSTPAQELERDRQARLCAGMQMNRYLPNGTYVDCLTDDYAIEVDFSNKWAEAIGQ